MSSFLITTLNRPEDLAHCVESILEQTAAPGEIVIVDASDVSCEALIRPLVEQAGVALVYITAEPGRTRQLNRGARAVSGDPVCIVDDDVILEPDFNAGILRTFAEGGDAVGGVQGTIIDDTYRSPFRRGFRRLFLLSRHTSGARGRVLASGYYTTPVFPSVPTPAEALRLCGLAFRRTVLEEFSFDESLVGYALKEDVDFSYRVSRKYELLVTPYARFRHLKSPVARIDERAKARMHVVNNYRLFRKNMAGRRLRWLAFAWAMIGRVLYAAARSVARRRTDYLAGTLRGLSDVLTQLRENRPD